MQRQGNCMEQKISCTLSAFLAAWGVPLKMNGSLPYLLRAARFDCPHLQPPVNLALVSKTVKAEATPWHHPSLR